MIAETKISPIPSARLDAIENHASEQHALGPWDDGSKRAIMISTNDALALISELRWLREVERAALFTLEALDIHKKGVPAPLYPRADELRALLVKGGL